MWGCPQPSVELELVLDRAPQPWGLACSLKPVLPGTGEDDSAPREVQEARPTQGKGRLPGRKWDREQAGVFVLCPKAWVEVRHPRASQTKLLTGKN